MSLKAANVSEVVIFLAYNSFVCSMIRASSCKNSLPDSRHSSRGSAYLFAPMVNFNVMAEVGDTPP
ncbi:hypothetical protein H6G06_25615 [Anabaena sphaerica FACHB-251]|uniref:Uncharacterized protein n=1 Tax=Anabaena sphaerica FACHB-251 TaxID=2692883 RepID=A0A927A3R6_9NOST|nr:hypothetical protein [Anabaena sphaerica]MBD2296768.1 hypothetical protein [Anabaena sphaerica FACHB-251]